jgi:hypothetical protein
MRRHFMLVLFLGALFGCSQSQPLRYASYEAAFNAEATGRKLLSEVIPKDAHDIVGWFDVDSGQMDVEFNFADPNYNPRIAEFKDADASTRSKILDRVPLPHWSSMKLNSNLEVYEGCEGSARTTLLVDRPKRMAFFWMPSSIGAIKCM